MNLHELIQKKSLQVIGLMSGTSMDGLDICLAHIVRQQNQIKGQLLKYQSLPYTLRFSQYLQGLVNSQTEAICQANFRIAREWSSLIKRFLQNETIDASQLDLIGSHGQTIWHQDKDSTLQIGEAAQLAEDLQLPVVSDFRVRDIAAGGSGAPLIPYIDYILFKDIDKTVLLLNIGGIANFTILPAGLGGVKDIYALDTGPGNALIDATAQIISQGEQPFDKDGQYARQGQINKEILQDLQKHPYLDAPLPKSTGKEVFGTQFVHKIIKKYQLETQSELLDLIATFTYFTAVTIHSQYEKFFSQYPLDEIIVSGGGANNPVLMQYLKNLFKAVKFIPPEQYGINADAKEAFAFALLAAHRIWGIPANVPNATGARHPVVLGKITN